MKRIICYLRTIKELRTVIETYINFGSFYIAHDYVEKSTKLNKNSKRIEQILVCQTCGSINKAYLK